MCISVTQVHTRRNITDEQCEETCRQRASQTLSPLPPVIDSNSNSLTPSHTINCQECTRECGYFSCPFLHNATSNRTAQYCPNSTQSSCPTPTNCNAMNIPSPPSPPSEGPGTTINKSAFPTASNQQLFVQHYGRYNSRTLTTSQPTPYSRMGCARRGYPRGGGDRYYPARESVPRQTGGPQRRLRASNSNKWPRRQRHKQK